MTVGAHRRTGMKIHYVEINGLHDQHLSQREPFWQSVVPSQRPVVGGNTLMVDDDTLTDDSGALTVDDDTSMVNSCT
jgi:hypothetical protein